MKLWFIHFHCNITFKGLSVPQLVDPFFCLWTSGLSPGFANLNNVSLNILTNSPSCTSARVSLGHISGRGIAGSYGMKMFNFTRYCQFFPSKVSVPVYTPTTSL